MAVGFKGTSWEYVKPQTAQEKAVQNVQEKLTYTNVDPRITQRESIHIYTTVKQQWRWWRFGRWHSCNYWFDSGS